MRTMSRPPRSPDAEQQRLIDAAVAANREWLKIDEAAQAAEQEMWDAIERARVGGAQANHLLEALGDKPSRATFFRRFRDPE
jgi:hypothetical protein